MPSSDPAEPRQADVSAEPTQVCASCGQELPLSQFSGDLLDEGAFATECKVCRMGRRPPGV